MRIAVQGETLLERLALRSGRVPLPALQSLAGMALPGVLVATVRLGLLDRLAARPATPEQLAEDLSLRADTTRLLLEALRALGYVRAGRRGRYAPTRAARRWLLADSPRSVRSYVASHQEYWPWWSRLPEHAGGAAVLDHHLAPADSPYWREYIEGQYELARFSAPEFAAAVRVPEGARHVLDVGGGHGWYAARLCARHRGLRATVLDLPGSVAVGRRIIADAGWASRVEHREGDARTAELGAGHDVLLCLNLLHHLRPEEIPPLLRRFRAALRPGGTLAVLDLFARDPDQRGPDATAAGLGLLFHLSSGASLHGRRRLLDWLADSGFVDPRGTELRRIPGQVLYQVVAG